MQGRLRTRKMGQNVNDYKSSLAETTRRLLRTRSRDVTLNSIAEATGIDIHFISSFNNDNIAHPSVHKVQRIYEFLTGRNLEY